ncbi:histidine ammonia-lyase [Streptomyces sp. NPDC048385]|uniref:HAL/PAL/TAL family ammonia-lyase n=1 Tax=Streptomyces sp. NPDC048385 TaxID=3155145 RepID=UPI0034458210
MSVSQETMVPAPAAPVVIGHAPLAIADIVAVARHGAPVTLTEEAVRAVEEMRVRLLADLGAGAPPVYGLTTGVGDLYSVSVTPEHVSRAQLKILKSHACGVGAPYPVEVMRAMILLIVRAMAQGRSGVSIGLLDTLVAMLNRGVTPWSPGRGSVGYLIGTAHIGLVVAGLGQAYHGGALLSGAEAMRRAGLPVRDLGPREGHALVSGTYEVTAMAALAVHDARALTVAADIAAAMSLEALRGNDRAFDPQVQQARPHPGQTATATNLRTLLDGSEIVTRYRHHRLQDPLSLRCAPQVHGSARDALDYVERTISIEANSVTDNPLFSMGAEDDTVTAHTGGNGHGAPVAMALDVLTMAVTHLLNISERRTDRLTNAHVSELPAFLAAPGGEDSGFMIPQYVTASLAAEARALAQPASVHSIPTSAMQEDHVSMGVPAGWQAWQAVEYAQQALGIEVLAAAQALEYHGDLRPGTGTGAAYRAVRERVPRLEEDREMYPDLAAAGELVADGALVAAVEAAVGPLAR